MHCDSPAAYEAFTNDPDFLSIKHLRDECTDLLSVGGRLIRANPAPPDEQRVYGIEMVEFPNGSPAAYRRYELEGEQAMAKYGFQAEYVLHVETTSSVDRHFDMAKVSSFPSMAHRAAFESDPVHAHRARALPRRGRRRHLGGRRPASGRLMPRTAPAVRDFLDLSVPPITVAAVTWRPAVDVGLRDAYLRRLGFAAPPPPTVETLFAVHRAQVERVPYECVWLWLGEQRTIDPLDSVRHVVTGRGGYCYHMNGSLSALLTWLGFDVRWRFGGVQGGPKDPIGPSGNHLVLEVHGLPSTANPDGRWLADTGLGDGLHEPLPLMPGVYRQGPAEYTLAASDAVEGGWRFTADPRMSLLRVDWAPGDASPADFAAKHQHLSTSPESGFVRVLAAFRRDANGWDVLRGCILKRFDHGESTRELTSRSDWYAALGDVFGLPLADVDEPRRTALWNKVRAAHETYLATRIQ